MARYIDIEPLEKEGWYMARVYNDSLTSLTYETKKLKEFPTADVRENIKGEWFVSSDGKIKCSNCLKIPINEIRIRGDLVYYMKPIKKLMKFCPNCGAEMRKEVES